jgi:hypothetical protein
MPGPPGLDCLSNQMPADDRRAARNGQFECTRPLRVVNGMEVKGGMMKNSGSPEWRTQSFE